MHEAQGESLMDLLDSLVQDITDQARLIPMLTSKPELPDIKAEREAAAAAEAAAEAAAASEAAHEEEEEGEEEEEEVDGPSSDRAIVPDAQSSETGSSAVVSEAIRLSSTIKDKIGYSLQVMQTPEIAELVMKITDHVTAVMHAATDYQANLESNYAFYWAEDRREFIRQFCSYGRLLKREDIGPNEEILAPENPPTLEQFRDIILKYDKVFEDVEKLEDAHIFDNWMRVDMKPFKTALLTAIRQWSDKFKQYLVDHVTNTLNGLNSFIHDSFVDLSTNNNNNFDADNIKYDKLVIVLERLKLIREAEEATDAGFEPLRETVALLKEFDEELPENITKLLEVSFSVLFAYLIVDGWSFHLYVPIVLDFT